MIHYKEVFANGVLKECKVYQNKTHIGDIIEVENGFQYVPNRSASNKERGEVCKQLWQAKALIGID